MLTLGVHGFHALPEDVRAEALDWLDEVVPDYYTFTVDVIDEGRVRIFGVRKERECEWLLDCCPWCGGWDGDIVRRALYTNVQPPVTLMRAMHRA